MSSIKHMKYKGGWQTPEKLDSLSKSVPIRTLSSLTKNKKKKMTKRKRSRKRKMTKKKKELSEEKKVEKEKEVEREKDNLGNYIF